MTGSRGVTGGSFGPAKSDNDAVNEAETPLATTASAAHDADDANAGGQFLLQPLGTVPVTDAGTCGPDSCEI